MSNKRFYRNERTGKVAEMFPEAAKHFPELREVRTDKPEVLHDYNPVEDVEETVEETDTNEHDTEDTEEAY